jgi:hypothetical protein
VLFVDPVPGEVRNGHARHAKPAGDLERDGRDVADNKTDAVGLQGEDLGVDSLGVRLIELDRGPGGGLVVMFDAGRLDDARVARARPKQNWHVQGAIQESGADGRSDDDAQVRPTPEERMDHLDLPGGVAETVA